VHEHICPQVKLPQVPDNPILIWHISSEIQTLKNSDTLSDKVTVPQVSVAWSILSRPWVLPCQALRFECSWLTKCI
jgi:hypothetical protein